MNRTEREIVARLLRLAGDEFSNHGCTEFDLDNTDENWTLWQEVLKKMSGTEEEHRPEKGPIRAEDWILMKYFADRLLEDSDEESFQQKMLSWLNGR